MSNPPTNVWHTAKTRHSHSTSRNQSRSGNASPAQQSNPSQPPRQSRTPAPPPTNNAWAQRAAHSTPNVNAHTNASTAGSEVKQPESTPVVSSTAQIKPTTKPDEQHTTVNNFNAKEVTAFLAKTSTSAVYKPAEAPGSRGSGGGAWVAKASNMANNQPFFVQLAKQVAAVEGGG